jgi:hypothetical protein
LGIAVWWVTLREAKPHSLHKKNQSSKGLCMSWQHAMLISQQ